MKAASIAMLMLTALIRVAAADGGTVRGVVTVTRANGVLPGAVLVYLVGFADPPHPPSEVEVKQRARRFEPEIVAITAGDTVTFPNSDPFMHNVFSATAERSFDLGSYPKGERRSRTFPSPGVVDVYCNIHPEMSAVIVVLPNHSFAIADASGRFEIKDVPAGTWTAFALSRHAVKPAHTQVTVMAGGSSDVTLALDEVQRDFSHHNKYGEAYRDGSTIYAGD